MTDFQKIRTQFKALDQKINGKSLVYLDSAATTLKPDVVVDRIQKFYNYETANVHRGAHYLANQATVNFESCRETIKNFIDANSAEEIVFTKGATETINLVVDSYAFNYLKENDEVVLTELEHHANLVPWQNLALKKNLKLKFINVLESGEIDLSSLDQVITDKTKIVSFSGCSNTLGTFLPIEEIIKKAKSVGAITIMDAAQLSAQKKISVKKLDIDFLAFSAHKIFGPFGFGALYGKKELLDKMPPYQFGGNMISEVTFEKSTYQNTPHKFETGTPHIEGAVGTALAIQFYSKINQNDIFNHEQELLKYVTNKLIEIPEIKIFGTALDKAPIISFNLIGAHHSDVGQILDQQGIAVRTGHHCTQPLLKKFGLTGTVRASFSIYNNLDDADRFIEGIIKAKRMLL